MITSKTDLEKLSEFSFEQIEMSLVAEIIKELSNKKTKNKAHCSNLHSLRKLRC